MKELEIGQYKIPDGCVCRASNGILTVRKSKKAVVTDYRCSDCVHYAIGRSMTSVWYNSTVCLLKPKNEREGTYYHVYALQKTCERFKKKEQLTKQK